MRDVSLQNKIPRFIEDVLQLLYSIDTTMQIPRKSRLSIPSVPLDETHLMHLTVRVLAKTPNGPNPFIQNCSMRQIWFANDVAKGHTIVHPNKCTTFAFLWLYSNWYEYPIRRSTGSPSDADT